MPSTNPYLVATYEAATYRVFWNPDTFDLHVGKTHPAFDARLRSHAIASWAFVTAWNPQSQPLSKLENDLRQQVLKEELTEAGYHFLPAVGMGDDPPWEEESLLVLQMEREPAVALGRQWNQHAIVHGMVGAPAALVWCSGPP